MKADIEKLLKDTKRDGIDDLCEYIDQIGFYDAPASGSFHGAEKGGLAKHSMNVLDCARSLAIALLGKKWWNDHKDSVTICALLHDLGKAGQFGKPLYVDNVLKTGISKAKPFKHNPDLITTDHEIVSVIEATKFIDLTEEEQQAILWHNGLYGIFKYEIPSKESELYMIIHFADLWASRVLEKGAGEDD